MKTALLALFTTIICTGAALAASTPTDESSPVVLIENLRADANAEGMDPDVIVAPRPTPAQQLRAAIDAAQAELFQDLEAARVEMAKSLGPADRLQANREMQQRKLVFEVEVFELQLEYARAIDATDRIEELEETVRVARERLDSDSAESVKPEMEGGR